MPARNRGSLASPLRPMGQARLTPVGQASITLLRSICFLLSTCLLTGSSWGQDERLRRFKLPPCTWAAFDHLSGNLATLNSEDGEVYLYPREFFDEDKASARTPQKVGPWKVEAGQTASSLCFARTPDRTWLAVSFSSGGDIVLLDPVTLKTDAIVSIGSNGKITELNAPFAPESGRLFFQTGGRESSASTGIIDLREMKSVGFVNGTKVRDQFRYGFLPSAKGTLLYTQHIACRLTDTTVEEIGRTYEGSRSRTIVDKQQSMASTGYAVLSADYADTITEFDFLIYDFAPDGSIVAGLDVGSNSLDLCLGSLGNFETLARVRMPEIFLKSLPRGHRQIGSLDSKGHYEVFIDSDKKRVLVFHSGMIAAYDYSHLAIPMVSSGATADFPEEIFIGETYDVTIKIPQGATLDYDRSKLKGVTIRGEKLRWKVLASEQGRHPFRVKSASSAPEKTFTVDATWRRYAYSFLNSGSYEPPSRLANPALSIEPSPEGMSADVDSIAVWAGNTLLLLDASNGKQVWAHAFDSDVKQVVLGKRHIYVETEKGSNLKVVSAVSRSEGHTISDVEALSGPLRSDMRAQLVYRDGITTWTNLYGADKIHACVDATLKPVEGVTAASVIGGHISTQVYGLGAAGKPTLFVGALYPAYALSDSERRRDVFIPALGKDFYRDLGNEPSLSRDRERWRDESRRLLLTTGETGSRQADKTKLYIYSLDIGTVRGIQITDEKQGRAQIASNERNIFYLTDQRIHVIPYALLDLRLSPRLTIDHRQSTFLAKRSGETLLSYRVSGGQPPYKFQAACWLTGEKPEEIKRKTIRSENGAIELSLPAAELKEAAIALFINDHRGQTNLGLLPHFIENDGKSIGVMLDSFTLAQTPFFQRVIEKPPSGVPVPLPVRIEVTDSAGGEAYLGHYIFYELAKDEIETAIERRLAPKR